MSNVSTDESNKERINRWKCAILMFEKKPFFGWGPGTYMFKYAPFQLPQDKTSISTNTGSVGNAHSEYLEVLSDSGLFGLISFLGIIIFTILSAIRVIYSKRCSYREQLFVTCAILGLVTYYVHSTMNDFLQGDKASALFWGYTAIIVAIDIRIQKREKHHHKNSMPNMVISSKIAELPSSMD